MRRYSPALEMRRLLHEIKRQMYRGDRPGALARFLNAVAARQYAAGVLARSRDVTLEVRGRRSGRTIRVPVVIADLAGERYLVSMLGERANWVHNVRRARGQATLRHRGGDEPVHLVEVPPEHRAPILRRYLAVAPGARPHLPVGRNASLPEFASIADGFPVFRIDAAG
ncbi:nitroreductase/quinone reductase family protein [Mycolicibacterium litorale]|uniref:nitroreductase/quinone reductase family protein n=1 Tax=Mycolicibacterium litorale TaxID=758802 RepID=UPI003CECB421